MTARKQLWSFQCVGKGLLFATAPILRFSHLDTEERKILFL
jgi:hypothetical protein